VIIELYKKNVIRFPNQNTLSTRVKQIRNPQKEISGGFFYVMFKNEKDIHCCSIAISKF